MPSSVWDAPPQSSTPNNVHFFKPGALENALDLPTQHLPKLGWLSGRARELTGLAGLLAATLLALGVLAAADRPRVLHRAGRWALRAGVGWAAFGWALPSAMTKLGEPRLAALGALGVAAVGPMIAPAVTLVCTGVGALLGARAWRLALAALPPAPPSSGPGSSGPGTTRLGSRFDLARLPGNRFVGSGAAPPRPPPGARTERRTGPDPRRPRRQPLYPPPPPRRRLHPHLVGLTDRPARRASSSSGGQAPKFGPRAGRAP